MNSDLPPISREPLIAFSRESDARLLLNYLNQQGIDAEYCLVDAQHPHALILNNPVQGGQAELLIKEFLQQPNQEKYQQAAWESGEATASVSSGAFRHISITDLFNTPFTALILVACILVYVISLAGGLPQLFQSLSFQSLSAQAETGQWWRLVGPAFLHFSALHIVFNLLWWGLMGRQIEKNFGSLHLLLVFLVTAILSNWAQFLMSGPNFGGLSGVVYGVLGFVWWCGWLRPGFGLKLSNQIVGFMLVWLVIGYADILWVSMANTAHTVGLVSGCLLAFVYSKLYQTE